MKISRIFLALAAWLILTCGASRATPMTWVGDEVIVQTQIPPPTVISNGNFIVPKENIQVAPVLQ